MLGFSEQWLTLREPVDHRSRNQALQTKLSALFATQQFGQASPMLIQDLGCGTGSNLRALALHLPTFQHWTLIDYDPALLEAAKLDLIKWAHNNVISLSPLTLGVGSHHIVVEFVVEDLAQNIERVLSKSTHLVTAAAFFDLVSRAWLERFCKSLNSPFYTVLTYNGLETWSPSLAIDEAVLAAFHQHQHQDKGFGLASGPQATDILIQCLKDRMFDVEAAPSPWVLSKSEDHSLIVSLAQGTADALSKAGSLPADQLSQWRLRSQQAAQCTIGHWDMMAQPAR